MLENNLRHKYLLVNKRCLQEIIKVLNYMVMVIRLLVIKSKMGPNKKRLWLEVTIEQTKQKVYENGNID